MPSIDTNVLVRWLIVDNPQQLQRIEKRLLADAPLVVSAVALTELEHVLSKVYQLPRPLIVSQFEALSASGDFKLPQPILSEVITKYAHHPALSFTDCWLAVEAGLSSQTPLYTFDKKLANQADQATLC